MVGSPAHPDGSRRILHLAVPGGGPYRVQHRRSLAHRRLERTIMIKIVALGLAALVATVAPAVAQSFVNFETGQVRPLALSPDGTRLFATNTPDNRLEIFAVGASGLT